MELLSEMFRQLTSLTHVSDVEVMGLWRSFAAKVLNQVPAEEPLGTELFNAHLRLGTGDAFELGCVRRSPLTQAAEVYLIRRAYDDSAYPGEWHLPGTFQRRKENPEKTARRLARKELFGRSFSGSGYFVKKFYPSPERVEGERGHTNSELWLFSAEQDLPVAEDRGWFDLKNLPTPMVSYHRDEFVPEAIAAYERWHRCGASAVHLIDEINPN